MGSFTLRQEFQCTVFALIKSRCPLSISLSSICLTHQFDIFFIHISPCSNAGTGAWESALTNTLSPGDRIVSFVIGQFSLLWIDQQQRLKFNVDVVESDWGQGANLDVLAEKLAQDHAHTIKAICIVHNETATGVTNNLATVRKLLGELETIFYSSIHSRRILNSSFCLFSVCLSFYLLSMVNLSIHLSFIFQFININKLLIRSMYLSISFASFSVYLSIYPSLSLPIHLSTYLFISLSPHLPIDLST